MSHLVTVDLGLHHCGLAQWYNGHLTSAQLVKNPVQGRGPKAWRAMAEAVEEEIRGGASSAGYTLIFERMVDYNRGVPAEDLMELVGVAGALSRGQSVIEIKQYEARRWKKSLPKPIHHKRVLGHMFDWEKALIQNKDKDTMDAVALGMYELGRYRV